jgi:hypothetical protein
MGYRSEVGAIISVDKTGRRDLETEQDVTRIEWYHTDEDKARFKELVGKMKLIMGHHLDESFNEDIGWYDCKIVLHATSSKWYSDYTDVRAWNEFWELAQNMEGVSGVFARSGEEDGDVEHDEFGGEPLYDSCQTYQGVRMDFATNKRTTDEEGQTAQDAVDKG